MRRLTILPLLVLLLWITPCRSSMAESPQTETVWMTVLLAGRRVGHLQVERRLEGNTLTTTQTLLIELNRNGKTTPLHTVTRSVETADGVPLGFSSKQSISAMDNIVDGKRQPDGRFEVTSSVGGVTQQSMLDWPQGALLAEGQRLAMLSASRHPGRRYELLEFDPASQQTMHVSMEVLGDEHTDLPEGLQTLNHQRQQLQYSRGMQTLDLWLDDHGKTLKGQLTLLGRPLEMLACSQACALAPTQDVDMMRAATIPSPRPLTSNLRASFLRYDFRVRGDIAQPFISTDEQRVRYLGQNQWQVDVHSPHAGGQPPPQAQDTQPDAWLQSDAPAIRRLATQAVGNARTDSLKMRRLHAFVSRYITQHSLSVGYASALEVVNNRQGDCTEDAVLLTALARAEGIPARVVTGMVYADRYAESSRVFLPHAWMQAWVNSSWQSFDAALGHFDSTHIALASGGGDPAHFFATSDLFGAIEIDRVTPDFEYYGPGPVEAPSTTANDGSAGALR